jgi:hypothetical protein
MKSVLLFAHLVVTTSLAVSPALADNGEKPFAEALNFPAGAGSNTNVGGIDDRIAIQITGIWSQ